MEGARAALGAEAPTVGAEAPTVGAEAGGRWAKPGGRCSPEAAGGGAPRSPSPFPFPFRPYPIQERFMAALYAALQAGQVGIFESPTGTVRSGTGNGGVEVLGAVPIRVVLGEAGLCPHTSVRPGVPFQRCASPICGAGAPCAGAGEKQAPREMALWDNRVPHLCLHTHELGLIPLRSGSSLCGLSGTAMYQVCGPVPFVFTRESR